MATLLSFYLEVLLGNARHDEACAAHNKGQTPQSTASWTRSFMLKSPLDLAYVRSGCRILQSRPCLQ